MRKIRSNLFSKDETPMVRIYVRTIWRNLDFIILKKEHPATKLPVEEPEVAMTKGN